MKTKRMTALESLESRLLLSADVAPTASIVINGGAAQRSTVMSIDVKFSEDLAGGLDASALVLRNQTTGQALAAGAATMTYDAVTRTAHWTFPTLPGASLADGRYMVSLLADHIKDLAGNLLDGNGDGIGGDDQVSQVLVKTGDANGDAAVNVGDLGMVASYYGQSGAGLPGDLDGNGAVDLNDLVAVASNYNTALKADAAAPAASFTSSVLKGDAPLTVTFDASASSDADGDGLSWTWNFGDGAEGSGKTVTHTFGAGNYNVTLTASDGSLTAQKQTTIAVNDPTKVQAFLPDASGQIVMDAENQTALQPGTGAGASTTWTSTTATAGYAGTSAMQAMPSTTKINLGQTTDGARLDYSVKLDPGTYYVWVRMLGPNTSSDSIHAGLDGQAATLNRWGMMTSATGQWQWVGSTTDSAGSTRVTVNVTTAGVHTFNLWVRESGALVDKVLLTKDANYTPTSTGPADSVFGRATNQAPVANADSATTAEDTPATIDVLANDKDADGDPLTITGFTQGKNGTVAASNGKLVYTPAANYNGSDSFTYTISDGLGGTATGTVAMTITPVNDPPVAVDDSTSVLPATATPLDLLANDKDVDGDTLSILSITQPLHGTAVLNQGAVTYTSASGYSGNDAFTYTITDGHGGQASANVSLVVQNATPPPSTSATDPAAWNHDQYYYIDRDGDGYGPASPKGPDANDNDPTVNTYDSAIAKYGTVDNMVHQLGYNPSRIFVVAAGATPTGLQPGDMVIYRAGTVKANYAWGISNLKGTADKPIVFMAMPGEKVVFDGATQGMEIDSSSYITLDGFVVDNTQGGSGQGIGMKYSDHITLRNMESMHHTWGMIAMQGLSNILTEYSVFHDQGAEHGVYWGARDLVDTNMTLRYSLMYRNGRHGFQGNGRIGNLLLDHNIIHTNNMGGVSLIEGVHDSTIQNNLIFNNNKQGIIFYTYTDPSPAILPYPETNNVVQNNVIWVGQYSWNGSSDAPANYTAILWNDTTGQNIDLGHNTIRNNTLITYRGATFQFAQAAYANTTTITGNTIYRYGGSNDILSYGGTIYDWAGFQAFSSTFSNNVYKLPNFQSVSLSYYNTPEKFNFNVV